MFYTYKKIHLKVDTCSSNLCHSNANCNLSKGITLLLWFLNRERRKMLFGQFVYLQFLLCVHIKRDIFSKQIFCCEYPLRPRSSIADENLEKGGNLLLDWRPRVLSFHLLPKQILAHSTSMSHKPTLGVQKFPFILLHALVLFSYISQIKLIDLK